MIIQFTNTLLHVHLHCIIIIVHTILVVSTTGTKSIMPPTHVPLRVQQEMVNTDKSKQASNAQRRHAHAEEIRKQVRRKEEEKIGARRGFFEEGNKLDQEAKDRYEINDLRVTTTLYV